MFFTEIDCAWLEETWQACHTQEPLRLTPHECRRLAHGFVGCNLVLDLIREGRWLYDSAFFNLPDEFAPGIACEQLFDWLNNPNNVLAIAGPETLAALVSPEAAPIVETRAIHYNPAAHCEPWCQINLWLFRESIWLHLTNNTPRPHHTEAFRQACELFAGPATVPQPPGQHSDCLVRSGPDNPLHGGNLDALTAFTAWWNDATIRLAGYLDDVGWQNWDGPNLRHRFCPPAPSDNSASCWAQCGCLLYQVVYAKYLQWHECSGVAVPAPYFAALASRLLFVETFPTTEDQWSSEDDTLLTEIVNWAQHHHPAALAPPSLPVQPQLARPFRITQAVASQLLPFLESLHGAPPAWGPYRTGYAEDLFSRRRENRLMPGATGTPFADWLANAEPLGI